MNHMKERGEREEPQEEKEEGEESFEAFKARRGDTPGAWWEWGLSDLRKEMTANMGELRREMDERSRSTNRINDNDVGNDHHRDPIRNPHNGI
jgi:hypothetical protein